MENDCGLGWTRGLDDKAKASRLVHSAKDVFGGCRVVDANAFRAFASALKRRFASV
jgi:hypothetical protein